ncbi:hypothetical protein P8V03_12415 [Clostridium sp. A1-XYC3]|uniref:Transposase n=1 Tax=Clostridium tanneri TaxID=3037988 RepID=A0ABU4JUY5_9CLOT|nr:hypothetical protein [Clostridium sp. A1-XYC3]MDW8801952.1 hypothetical protein [Clostridium sp. A1-XYC3]
MTNSKEKINTYEETRDYAINLFSKGMCMGEVMKKTNMTEEEIAKFRDELDKD